MKNFKNQIGLTLVELLIGMLLGVIVIGGAISVFGTSVKGQSENIRLTRLNQDLRAMMDVMVRDIRRAGFVTSSPSTQWASLQANPFFINANSTELAIYDSGRCIVYSYNRDDSTNDNYSNDDDGSGGVADGLIDIVATDRMGFRLDTANNELEMRRSGTNNGSCSNGTWESLTEPEVEITALQFTLTTSTLNVTSMIDDDDNDGVVEPSDTDGIPYGDYSAGGIPNDNGYCDIGEVCDACSNTGASGDPACLSVRNVTITLEGRLAIDNAVTQSITEEIRIRNDKFVAAVP